MSNDEVRGYSLLLTVGGLTPPYDVANKWAANTQTPGGGLRVTNVDATTGVAALVPSVTKIASATGAGDTTVWTPTAGKKFNLMRGTISIAGTAAAATPVRLRLTDGAGGTVLAEFRFALDTTLKGDTQIPFDFGNGELSAAADNLLVANLDTALASGAVALNISGTEV